MSYSKSIELHQDGRQPKLSFCITHMHRFESLKKTLAKNLNDNLSKHALIEFILVDFTRDEEIVNWIKEHFLNHIQSGYLKFFQSDQLKKWSAPIAKNTAHMLANGVIVTNLDCDNYTGPHGGEFVINKFSNSAKNIIFWQFSGTKRDGTFGRISMLKKSYIELGGYDQSFYEMGFQDRDLINRARKFGLLLVQDNSELYNQALLNKKYDPDSMTFEEMNKLNQMKSKTNIRKKKYVANVNMPLGVRGLMQMGEQGAMKEYKNELLLPNIKARKKSIKKVCFIHVPKCGGTSILETLRKSIGIKNSSLRSYQINAAKTRQKSEELGIDIHEYRQAIISQKMRLPWLSLIAGHTMCGPEFRARHESKWQLITVLRHPVERWFSHYFYNKFKTSDHFRHHMSLEEYVNSDSGKWTTSIYLEFFGEKGLDDDEKVISAIRNLAAFDFVGILEEQNQLKFGFERLLNKPWQRLNHRRKNPHKYMNEDIPENIYQKIEYMCRHDLKIYHHFLIDPAKS